MALKNIYNKLVEIMSYSCIDVLRFVPTGSMKENHKGGNCFLCFFLDYIKTFYKRVILF